MPVHLGTAIRDLSFLFLQLFRLLRQPGRRGSDLLGLLLHFGLAAFELGRAVQQRLFHLADAALPFDQLLPERGHRQAMFISGDAHSQILLQHALRFGLDVLPGGFEVFTALAGVTVNLGELFAQLLACPQ